MGILLNLLVSGLAVFVTAYILPGVHVDTFLTAIIVAVVMGIINAFIKPLLLIFTLPLTILTLGLFSFIINGILVLIADALIEGFSVDNFLWAVLFSLVISVVNWFLQSLTK